jgi:guanylate kinase
VGRRLPGSASHAPRTPSSACSLDLPRRAPHHRAVIVDDPLETPPPPRRGLMFVLASPSGAGKTSMAKRILAEDPGISLSVSATTRPARPGEVDGVDYHFVNDAQFDQLVAEGALLEWAHVFGKRYGTPRDPVREALAQGRDIIFDIDWQGTQQLKARDSKDVVSVYILPPSLIELESRLRARGTDAPEIIADRMSRAASEISHWGEYDYVLVNDDFDACLEEIRSILRAERLRRSRCKSYLSAFVRDMLAQGVSAPAPVPHLRRATD